MRKADPFKGLHRVRRKHADGRVAIHCYAWRGGPALVDDRKVPLAEGTAAFAQAFLAAKAGIKIESRTQSQTVQDLVSDYRKSSPFLALSKPAARNYEAQLKKIEKEFGFMPILALEARPTRGLFMRWRDGMAQTPRTADYAWMVLARVLSVAKERGDITTNPCERGGRLYAANRQDAIWSEEDLSRLFAVCSIEVRAAVIFALWTGQRQGDILKMPWSALSDGKLRFQQHKTNRPVTVPLSETLAAMIGDLPKVGTVILTSSDKLPWTSDGFRTSFGRACAKAKIEGLTFHDLRGTAVTRLALAGCSALEIASITGHTEKDVSAMLDRHYLGSREKLAEAAIFKLETRTKTVNGAVNGSTRSSGDTT